MPRRRRKRITTSPTGGYGDSSALAATFCAWLEAAAKASGSPRAGRATARDPDPRAAAAAALTRLVRLNRPGRVSLAGAYAVGYGALGMAQHDGGGPDWYYELDPLDTLFLGMVFPRSPPMGTRSVTPVPRGCC